MNKSYRLGAGWALSLSIMLGAAPVCASPSSISVQRHREFRVPPALRARVDFWKDVFARHGKHEVLIHHRDYPQLIFLVVDLRAQGAELNAVAFDSFKRREVEKRVNEVKTAFRRLAGGAKPISSLEERIERLMRSAPEGYGKYQRVLDEDLIRSQTGIREKFAEAVQRSGRYLPAIEKIFVQDFSLPLEVTRLPFVESSFDYRAYSSAGAAGIWQFMPRTARTYMTVTPAVDERLDPFEATYAAARYLSSAYRQLGTWPLALVSYNHGVGGVAKKVRAMGTTDIVRLIENRGQHRFGFASANFYPSFLAALEVYDEYGKYFPGIEPEAARNVNRYRIPQPVSAAQLSRALQIDLEVLRAYNYALLSPVWTGRSAIPAGYMLQVPAEYEVREADLRIAGHAPPVSAPASSAVYGGVFYRVQKGDTLGQIARKYGVSTAQLKKLNNISEPHKLPVGKLLVIKEREKHAPKKSTPAPAAASKRESQTLAAASTSQTYRVQPGDTLHYIARKHNISVAELQTANSLKSGMIRVGQTLTISAARQETAAPAPVDAAGRSHVVQSGESLWLIARRYGVKSADIKQINQLSSDKLRVGQTLQIP